MKITALVENTTINGALRPKHGLCLYIETASHKILFDLGPDGTYRHNAARLGIDLAGVDTVVISHGHTDHGGGLADFLQHNQKAQVYMHRRAFEPHYLKVLFAKFPVGLNPQLADEGRLHFTDGPTRVDDELLLFSNVEGEFATRSNRALYAKTRAGLVRDDFAHEQSLLVSEGGTHALFTGCSHRGVLNILQAAQCHQPAIGAVFGGFHLFNPATRATEPAETVQALARQLANQSPAFYTCHCTGRPVYEAMKPQVGERLHYFATGCVANL